MNQENKKKISMELDILEADLIMRIRNKYQWGEITIKCQGGLPHSIIKITNVDKLGVESYQQFSIS